MAIEMMHVDGLVSGPLTSLLEVPSATRPVSAPATTTSDWRTQLPVLHGHAVHLRELRASDAASLFALLTTAEVSRFISPPPPTVEGFVRFIEWTRQRRAEGKHVCFAIVPDGCDTAVGLIQFHATADDFSVAEWGFALGSAWWGKGLFMESAKLVLEFAFDHVGVRRLEARAVTENGRGNGALRKLGAVREAELRLSFARGRRRHNQYLWSILEQDWRRAKFTWDGATTIVH
jgi:ribosomal-protein-alanine N-acetyltransferase